MLHDRSIALLRVGLACVLLYFGYQQAVNPTDWAGLVPSFLTHSFFTANNIVMLNSFLELTLGIFLLLGLYTRLTAGILGIHLIGIMFSLGFNRIGVRDFGLAMATLALALHDPDAYTLDARMSND